MHMSFWWDYRITNFLIYGWNISTVLILVLSCFGLVAFALFTEWVKMLQAKVRQTRLLMIHRQLRNICPSESDTLLTSSQDQPSTSTSSPRPAPPVITRKDRIVHFVYDISLWLSQNVLGYILMLIVMLYNGYMVIAIIIGSSIGYFIFGPTMLKINIENCRAMRSTFCMPDCGEPDKTALLRESNDSENRTAETTPACHASTSSSSTIISETAPAVQV